MSETETIFDGEDEFKFLIAGRENLWFYSGYKK